MRDKERFSNTHFFQFMVRLLPFSFKGVDVNHSESEDNVGEEDTDLAKKSEGKHSKGVIILTWLKNNSRS